MLRALWPEIVAAARARSPILGQALEAASPASLTGNVVGVEARAGEEFLVQGALSRQAAVIEEILAERLPGKPAIRLVRADASPEAKVMAPQDLRATELDRIRRMDPTLDVAATELFEDGAYVLPREGTGDRIRFGNR